MKRTVTFMAVMFATWASAQSFELLKSTSQQIDVAHQFNEEIPLTTELNGIVYWNLDNTYPVTLKDIGAPALPTFSESVVVPNQGALDLEITHSGYTEYSNVSILPSKGSLKRNIDPSTVAYTFGQAYQTNAFFPGELATMSVPFNLRNTRGAAIHFSPVQYNPVTGVVRIYHNIRASLKVYTKEDGLNELPETEFVNDVFSAVYTQQYLNANALMGRYTPVEETGDMLIITSDNFTDEIANLVEWKTQSGIRTTVVNMTTVGSADSDIKNYITTFYAANPNLVFVLLVGDHAQVPSHTYGLSGGEQLWSDTYYGQMTGGANDYYPELFVGRLSGSTSAQITTQVDRILEYEKNPAAGDWMTKAIGLASDEGDGIGDDGESDWQHARNIRTGLMNYGYTQVHEFYDGSHGGDDAAGNPNSTIILPAVNSGVGLFNYTGHGAENVCVTGNFSSTNVDAAANNGYYPFVISVACNNGTFTSGTCISEVWSWADNAGSPAGAIAACGSSILMAWAEPMQTQDEMAAIIAENYPTNKKATLGGLFYNSQMSVLEDYGNSATAREIMQTWVMFGDPSVLFRNKVTMNMVVTHVNNVPLGTTSVVINCDTEGALITIVQDGQIIGQAEAFGGNATINFTSLSSNLPLLVTAVKQNYKPYQGIITVAYGPAGLEDVMFDQLSIYPNPATDVITLSWNAGLEVENVRMFDLSGKEVLLATVIENGANMNISTLSSGMYIVRVETKGQSKSYRIVVQ